MDLRPEVTEHLGMLPKHNDCDRYFCTELTRDVNMALKGCNDCEGAQWAIRNPDGNIQRESKGKSLTYTTTAPGTWAVEVNADNQKLTYLFIVEAGGWTETPSEEDTPEEVELPAPIRSSKATLPTVSSPPATNEPKEDITPKKTVPTPISTAGITLQLNGSQAIMSGLVDGGYAIDYDVDGSSYDQDITVSKGIARWPLKLETSKKQVVTINNIERKADGQVAAVRIQESYGETKQEVQKVVAPAAPSPPAQYVGKETRIGTTLKDAWSDCNMKWVSESQIKVDAKALAEIIDGKIYLDQAGEVHINIIQQDGSSRPIIRKLSRGEALITFKNLYLEPGETATLSIVCKGCKMADVSPCNTASGKDDFLRLSYVQGVITLVDLKIRY
jgi:hypothetical protein